MFVKNSKRSLSFLLSKNLKMMPTILCLQRKFLTRKHSISSIIKTSSFLPWVKRIFAILAMIRSIVLRMDHLPRARPMPGANHHLQRRPLLVCKASSSSSATSSLRATPTKNLPFHCMIAAYSVKYPSRASNTRWICQHQHMPLSLSNSRALASKNKI